MIFFILDIFIYNLTSYNIPLFLMGIPYIKKYNYLIIYFLILIFFKWQYLFMLILSMFLFFMNKYLSKTFYFKHIDFLCIIINYIIYFIIYTFLNL